MIGWLAMLATLLSFSPLRAFDHPIATAFEATHHVSLPNLSLPQPAHVAITAEPQLVARSSSSDSIAATYMINNHPVACWRFAADFGFSSIDPHISMG